MVKFDSVDLDIGKWKKKKKQFNYENFLGMGCKSSFREMEKHSMSDLIILNVALLNISNLKMHLN